MIPKFRVWSNKMYPVRLIKVNKDDSITVNATDSPDDWNPIQVSGKFQNGYLMQCTGLQDKNGKDIYEQDILKFKEWSWSRRKGNIYKNFFVVVVWGHAGFTINGTCYTLNFEDGEVVGNVYENPELLKLVSLKE